MKKRSLVLGVSVVLIILFLGIFWRYKAKVGLVFAIDLLPFDLHGYQRLLVIAPHCDDESLSSAGLIQAALDAGMQVRVVIETNGDGYIFATMEEFHRIYPTHQNYVDMGNLRQQESLNALRILGVNSYQVSFLSYPDRGTPSLWEVHWSREKPFQSPYSGASRSPYPITFDTQAIYAGEDLLSDMRSILDSYHPDLVIYPHPEDVHPDHWGLSNFTRLALAMAKHSQPDYQFDAYAYLVHRPDFPVPKGLKPNASLTPPPKLFDLDSNWWRFDLNQEEVDRKSNAITMYRSQLPLLRTLLESFVRSNELLAQPRSVNLVNLAEGNYERPDTWRDSSGNSIGPIQLDPVQDFLTRDLVPPADFVALYAAKTNQNELLICAELDRNTSSALIYTVRIKAISDNGIKDFASSNRALQTGERKALMDGKYVCTQYSFSELGQPWLIFAGANAEETGVGILDQVAWQAVNVEPTLDVTP